MKNFTLLLAMCLFIFTSCSNDDEGDCGCFMMDKEIGDVKGNYIFGCGETEVNSEEELKELLDRCSHVGK